MEIKRTKYTIKGNELSVLESGDKNNPIALFVHGIPANAKLWTRTMEQLSDNGYYALAFDIPGFGETKVTEDFDYSLKGTASLINNWLIEQNFENIWLIAHDIGGGISQIMLTLNESLYQKVTLSNSITADTWPVPAIEGIIGAAKSGMFTSLAETGAIATQLGPVIKDTFVNKKSITDYILNDVFLDSKFNSKEGRDKFIKLLKALDPKHTIENMKKLSKVTIPLHLIWAMQDPNQPWDGPGKILKEAFKTVRVSQIENAGHFLQLDTPEEYFKLLIS